MTLVQSASQKRRVVQKGKVVIPDHKVYFVTCATEDEAAYLTGFLNAPIVARAINAYAAQLSLGTSVVEYLQIPPFTQTNCAHVELSALAKTLTRSGSPPSQAEWDALDALVADVVKIPETVLGKLNETISLPSARQ